MWNAQTRPDWNAQTRPDWNAQTHYDGHAQTDFDERAGNSLRKRAMGPAAPLKRFHNKIKRHLISRFATRASRYLDVACGRGGDILKWRDAQVRHVRGVDISPAEIREARRRCERGGPCATRMEFSVCDDAADFIDPEPYDVVACMFALHYFFDTEAHADRFLQMVAINLKPGGFFIGTFPDGRRVLSDGRRVLSDGRRVLEATTEASVDLLFDGPPRSFGSAYRCTIPDTVVDGDGSVEYLVFPETLVALAERHGLRPVTEGYEVEGTAPDVPGIRRFVSDNGVSELFATFAFVMCDEATPSPYS